MAILRGGSIASLMMPTAIAILTRSAFEHQAQCEERICDHQRGLHQVRRPRAAQNQNAVRAATAEVLGAFAQRAKWPATASPRKGYRFKARLYLPQS